ncbi:MAG TPA: YgjP-like metallopeptidase domain-containing protein, partial [Sphingomonadales bacterium]|nr:YgjP-like metallopeptidase domain-containing protein [Sphingomonadales bacterium]
MFFRKKPPEESRRQAGDLDYTLVRSSRRTLALQIREGELIVRAPHKTPLREIEDWIFEKRNWIARHQHKAKTKTKPACRDGELHPYLGENYPLRIDKGRKTACDLLNGEIRLMLRGKAAEAAIKRALKAWYTSEARAVFDDRLSELFPPFEARGHKRPEIRLRWMKSRWGSMGSHGKMTLN